MDIPIVIVVIEFIRPFLVFPFDCYSFSRSFQADFAFTSSMRNRTPKQGRDVCRNPVVKDAANMLQTSHIPFCREIS
jgi:hypothetical protein